MAIATSSDSEFNNEPNVIPLVDVMLVLLIIFIITIPVMTHAVKIDLPRGNPPPTDIKPETVDLRVDFDGTIYWNEAAIDQATLRQYVASDALKDPQPEVHIRADKRVRYEYVANVLFTLQRGGMKKVGFIPEALSAS